MLYLVTGANGTGKTLNTLKWVREMQIKEGRPVAYNGRFDAVADGELASWKKIEFADWPKEPDGTIFLMDECHNDMPKRAPSSPPPAHVALLGEHRKRGFDFFLITQHPSNIDVFVRKLIGSPGWHRHLKRTFGVDMVSMLQWSHVNEKCELPSSGKTGTVTMVAFPKEVYKWYHSAQLHTGKKKIPKQVWWLCAVVVLVPFLGWLAWSKMAARVEPAAAAAKGAPQGFGSGQSGDAAGKPKTPTEYALQYQARIPGIPYSAPVYDKLTEVQRVPVPAACVTSPRFGCRCYTQDATPYDTTPDLCAQIVAKGVFLPFAAEGNAKRSEEPPRTPVASPEPAPTVVAANTRASAPVTYADGPADGITQADVVQRFQRR